MSDQRETYEASVLNEHPGLRDEVGKSAEFVEWLRSAKHFEMDGETFYLPWSDVPMDIDQMIYLWARDHAMLGPQGGSSSKSDAEPR